jgi:hypothetical protein
MLNLKVRSENGRGAVKAGCEACQDLCAIYDLSQQVVRRIQYFERDYVPAVEATPAKVA